MYYFKLIEEFIKEKKQVTKRHILEKDLNKYSN